MLMHTESWTMQQIRRARERGQRMANARWKLDRERRDQLAAKSEIDPLRVPGRIIQRVVVITGEKTVTEIIRRDTTTQREWARLKRKASL